MSEAIVRALKWYLLALSIIIGASAFLIVNFRGTHLPWLAVVGGFGAAYVMSVFWRGFRGKTLFVSAVVFVAMTVLSLFSKDILYVAFDISMIGYSPYFMWGLTMAVVGVPLMCLVFYFVDTE